MKLLWVACLVALAPQIQASTATWNGIQIEFVAKLEPATNWVDPLPGGVVMPKADGGPIRRSISDERHRQLLEYDLMPEAAPDSQAIRLRVGQFRLIYQGGVTQYAPSKSPEIPVVHVGETVALELLVNPVTGQKLVDYLSLRRAAPEAPKRVETARDFTPADVQLRLGGPRVWENGKLLQQESANDPGVSAHVLYMNLPRRGTFEFSLWPEPKLGFHKAGTVSGNSLTFRVGASDYRLESEVPIAPSTGVFNIYVRYKPASTDIFVYGGSDHAGQISIK